ncbi:hypothetical protein SAMN05216262_101302 [Colwellia chukchiensis]|uniref:Uncharacterized protein n=1 Tax=Colwellia chukchiensis TaxID=641665 RepID=A0A1H7GTF7_9GAMM|nr:hypothetical protein [Colwellia chukchiensis]SEK41446.1 hypothetical protein SAMN05216262_101302 [Colwellia chukchiensis]
MKVLLLTLITAFTSLLSMANSAPEEITALDAGYMGVHGMVLMNISSTIFAYHLPLYHKPHDVQLMYKLKVQDLALVQLVRDNKMVTIKPKPFNLQRLMRGENIALSADVYLGHFERDGSLVYEDMTLHFAEQVYMRKLDDIAPASNVQAYDAVTLQNSGQIFIHQLQAPPSFDHLIYINVQAGCARQFNTSTAVPSEQELQYKFINCGSMKPLYYESQDFTQH